MEVLGLQRAKEAVLVQRFKLSRLSLAPTNRSEDLPSWRSRQLGCGFQDERVSHSLGRKRPFTIVCFRLHAVPRMSRLLRTGVPPCPRYVPAASEDAVRPLYFRVLHVKCIRTGGPENPMRRGQPAYTVFFCLTETVNRSTRKPIKIRDILNPPGCVMCEALKGGGDGHVDGDLKGLVNVRGTFTASSGRPRRRSRWGWPPQPTLPFHPKAKAAQKAAFALVQVYLRRGT
ncbi:Uncharacterised protein [Bordetella ansorpii]|uniref:Uncharacterized protein n=1 Tax=Bordetella ansorpii TaxID=288768 RepID=A0A157SWY7_9BORD|nr:Uncharacterised protein [Bordetella ansorpii]